MLGMNLYVLKRESVQAGEVGGIVLRGLDSVDARLLAASFRGHEGAEEWLDGGLSSCECLASGVSGEYGPVLISFWG